MLMIHEARRSVKDEEKWKDNGDGSQSMEEDKVVTWQFHGRWDYVFEIKMGKILEMTWLPSLRLLGSRRACALPIMTNKL